MTEKKSNTHDARAPTQDRQSGWEPSGFRDRTPERSAQMRGARGITGGNLLDHLERRAVQRKASIEAPETDVDERGMDARVSSGGATMASEPEIRPEEAAREVPNDGSGALVDGSFIPTSLLNVGTMGAFFQDGGTGLRSGSMTALSALNTYLTVEPTSGNGVVAEGERLAAGGMEFLLGSQAGPLAAVDAMTGNNASGSLQAGIAATFAAGDALGRTLDGEVDMRDIMALDRFSESAQEGSYGGLVEVISNMSAGTAGSAADVRDNARDDNMARDSAERLGAHVNALSADDSAQLIEAMLRGSSGDADERSALGILEALSEPQKRVDVITRVGAYRLAENFHGGEYDRLAGLLRDSYYPSASRADLEELVIACATGQTAGWEEEIIYEVVMAREGSDGRAIITSLGEGSLVAGFERLDSELNNDRYAEVSRRYDWRGFGWD